MKNEKQNTVIDWIAFWIMVVFAIVGFLWIMSKVWGSIFFLFFELPGKIEQIDDLKNKQDYLEYEINDRFDILEKNDKTLWLIVSSTKK